MEDRVSLQLFPQTPGQGRAEPAGGYGECHLTSPYHRRGDEVAQVGDVCDVQQDTQSFGFGSHRLIDRGVAVFGDGQEGTFQVTVLVVAWLPVDQLSGRQVVEGRGDLGADYGDLCAGLQESLGLALGLSAASNHDTAPVTQVQIDGIVGRHAVPLHAALALAALHDVKDGPIVVHVQVDIIPAEGGHLAQLGDDLLERFLAHA